MTTEVKEFFVAKEVTYHYSCPYCNKWWSVTDLELQDVVHCPHCLKSGKSVINPVLE